MNLVSVHYWSKSISESTNQQKKTNFSSSFSHVCMTSIDNLFFIRSSSVTVACASMQSNYFHCSLYSYLNRSFHIFLFFLSLARSLCMKYVFRSIHWSEIGLLSASVSCVVQMTLWEKTSIWFLWLWMMTVETIGQWRRTSMVNTQCTFRIFNVRKNETSEKFVKKKK